MVSTIRQEKTRREIMNPIFAKIRVFIVGLCLGVLSLTYSTEVLNYMYDSTIPLTKVSLFSDSTYVIYDNSTANFKWLDDYISTNTMINIPSDYATISEAIDFLKDKTISPEAKVTIKLSDNTYTLNSPIELNLRSGNQVEIIGNATTPSNVRLECMEQCFSIDSSSIGLIKGMHFVSLGGSFSAISVSNNSLAMIEDVRIEDFYIGISSSLNSHVTAFRVVADNNSFNTMRVEKLAFLRVIDSTLTNNNDGLRAIRAGQARIENSSITSNTSNPINASVQSFIISLSNSYDGTPHSSSNSLIFLW